MGNSRRSIFLQSLLSCAGVRYGGGGRVTPSMKSIVAALKMGEPSSTFTESLSLAISSTLCAEKTTTKIHRSTPYKSTLVSYSIGFERYSCTVTRRKERFYVHGVWQNRPEARFKSVTAGLRIVYTEDMFSPLFDCPPLLLVSRAYRPANSPIPCIFDASFGLTHVDLIHLCITTVADNQSPLVFQSHFYSSRIHQSTFLTI
jgi:hypothetical protein